jgi:hypothetical protein
MMDETGHAGMAMPLSAAEVAYSLVQQTSAIPDPIPTQELDPLPEPIWAQGSLATTDSLDLVLPSDKAVIEAMTSPDKPWEDLHHRSYFLPELSRIEAGEFTITMTGDQPCPINLLATQEIYVEGNMETINYTYQYLSKPWRRGECLRRSGLLPRRDSDLHRSFQIIPRRFFLVLSGNARHRPTKCRS